MLRTKICGFADAIHSRRICLYHLYGLIRFAPAAASRLAAAPFFWGDPGLTNPSTTKPFAGAPTVKEIAEDPHSSAREMHIEWNDLQAGPVKGVGLVPKFSATPAEVGGARQV